MTPAPGKNIASKCNFLHSAEGYHLHEHGIPYSACLLYINNMYCILTIFHLGTNIFEKTFLLETQIYFGLEQNYF